MNLFDPATGTWDNARTVTLILAQADGTPCPSDVKAQVVTMIEACVRSTGLSTSSTRVHAGGCDL